MGGGYRVGVSHYISIIAILELVDLAMAYVVKQIGKCGFTTLSTSSNVSPAFVIIFAPIQRQGASQNHVQWFTDSAGKELCVYIKSKGCLRVLGRCANSRHSVVFGLVACCDSEVLVEQLRVAGHARHLGRRSLVIAYIYMR